MLAAPVAHGHRAVLGSLMGCQGHKTLITLLLPALAAAPMRYGMLRGRSALGPLLRGLSFEEVGAGQPVDIAGGVRAYGTPAQRGCPVLRVQALTSY